MKKILVFLLLLAGIPAFAQTGAVQGLCSLGGTKATTSGANSSNYLNGIIPSCTVTVYLTGTTTKATIYSNNLSTPLANPFTANAIGSVNPGGWIFWATPNAGLDVVLSGGIAPNIFTSPVTLVDVFPSSSFTPVAGLTNINGQTGPSITLQSSGATINVTNPSPNVINIDTAGGAGGVSQLIAGSGISLSPTGGTGNVTVTNTGSFNPPTTNYVWVGDSRLMIATFNQVTATALSGDGTTITITLPNVAANWVDNAALVPGDSIQFFANTAWSPTCVAWGNATVLTASATQITVAENGLGPVTCSGVLTGTGGVVQKANYLIPQLTGREPYFLGHGTTYNMGVPGQTAAGLATQYTTYIHPLSPAVTGNSPGYLFIQAGSQDALGCSSAATIETALQNYWATAHADGWTIVMTTLIVGKPGISCAPDGVISDVNYWLRSQVKGYDATLTAAKKYWDQLVDVAEYTGDISDQNIFETGSEALHLNNGGTKTISSMMNLAMVAKGSIPPTPRAGFSVGTRVVDTSLWSSLDHTKNMGFAVFDNSAWTGNTSSGYFGFGIDKANAASPAMGFWGNQGFDAELGWKYVSYGTGAYIVRPTGGYCFLNGSGAFISQQGIQNCFKQIAATELALGNSTSSTDASSQLDLAIVKLGVASDPASPSNGQVWYNTTTNLLKAYINGVVTTLGAGGGSSAFSALTSSTNTTAAMVVGSGASMDYTGTGTIDANKLLTNTVPANGTGYFYNNGSGTLSWTLGSGATVKTTSYTALTSDGGLFVMNCASACVLTLPGASLPTGFNIAVQAVNSGAVTVDPSLLTIYLGNNTGGTSAVTVPQGQTMYIAWDGTAYRATAPWLAGANVTITPSSSGVTVAASATGSTAFSAITGSTNTTATMVVGSGASLAPTGTGTIQATNIASTIAAGSGVTITGSGTTASPYSIAASGSAGIGYGFTLNTGAAASPAFPNQVAPRTGTITTCKFLTQASDGATALVFNIKLAGTSILSGGTATIAAGTASQTVTTLTLTGSISVTAGNIWEFDITGGTSTWTGSLTCY